MGPGFHAIELFSIRALEALEWNISTGGTAKLSYHQERWRGAVDPLHRVTDVAYDIITWLLCQGQMHEGVTTLYAMNAAEQEFESQCTVTTLRTYKIVEGILLERRETTIIPKNSDQAAWLLTSIGEYVRSSCRCFDLFFASEAMSLYKAYGWWTWNSSWNCPWDGTNEHVARSYTCNTCGCDHDVGVRHVEQDLVAITYTQWSMLEKWVPQDRAFTSLDD